MLERAKYRDSQHAILFLEIIDKVIVMPIIKHINDSSIPSIIDNNTETSSTFTSRKDYKQCYTLKHRKYNIEAEYLENEWISNTRLSAKITKDAYLIR